MGEARETPLDTLFRELREEIIGHDAMSLYDQTGSDDHLSSAQKDVLCLLNQKKMETANAFGKSAIWSHSYAFKPNRFHPVQENWTRSVNHVFGLKFTAEELDKIAAVGTATTKYDQKELSGIEILGEKDLKRNIAKDPDFMGYKGEQKSLSLFMGNAGKIDPSPSLAAA